MKVIGQRIIEYLKSDSTLVSLLGGSRNIFARGLNEPDNRPAKYICIETSPGADLNYASGQNDDVDIEIGVSRKITNSFSAMMEIMERVDDLINKGETGLSNTYWKVAHIARTDSPTRGVLVDDKSNEYYAVIRYEYILDESS